MNVEKLEQELRTYRPAGNATLPAHFVWPRYDGLCVGNIAATVAQALNVPSPGMLPPLRTDLLDGMLDGVKRVIVLVMDAMGWEKLQSVMARYDDVPFHRFAEAGRLQPLTTSFLSTTNSVLSTIWTGRPPLEHGLLAYQLYLREWAMAVESISFSSINNPFVGELSALGFDPETFLPVPSLPQVLSVQGVLSYALIFNQFTTTPLSRMHFRGVREVRGHTYPSEFWLTLRRMLQEHRDERCLLGGYWSAVDTLAHRFGPLDETGDAEIRSVGMLMDQIFLRGLEPADRDGTLLLMTADHGQITTPAAAGFNFAEHPHLRDMLFLPPLGESRVPFFYVRDGCFDSAWGYLHEHFADHFHFFKQQDLIAMGLLGPGTPSPEVPFRLGNIVGIAKDASFMVRQESELSFLQGRHGGLTAQEMLVPLLAMRLDA